MRLITNIQNQGQAYQDFTNYCLNNLVPKMNRDVSKYAPNRYRLWLFNEPYLGNPPRMLPAYYDSYLDNVVQWLYPDCNTALISYHGHNLNFNSNASISHHRDAAFAMSNARLLNLCNTACFSYNHSRSDNNSNNCTIYRFNPGDLIEFNCKHLHACIQAQPGRIVLVMWQLKPNYCSLRLS